MRKNQKQKWITTPRFTHFCGFHPPFTNKNKNNSDFIFVGPRLITYLQQKWISFLLAFIVNKNENNFEDSMTYPSFPYYCTVLKYWYDSIVSSTMIQYISGSKRVLLSNNCLTVSGFALSFLPLSLYVYGLQLHSFVVRYVVAHHGKRWDLRCHRDNFLPWQ
jgi:hypothetical protein